MSQWNIQQGRNEPVGLHLPQQGLLYLNKMYKLDSHSRYCYSYSTV
jgi:hypothetical protein